MAATSVHVGINGSMNKNFRPFQLCQVLHSSEVINVTMNYSIELERQPIITKEKRVGLLLAFFKRTLKVHVFGNPITHGTRAQRALAAKNYLTDGKLDQVLLVSNQSIKAAAGGANETTGGTTIFKVCNATGSTIRYVTAYDWSGNVAGHYPVTIQNGQWAVFEHVGTCGPNQGSIGALVYNIDDFCDSMISWNNPWKTTRGGNNTAYCEMNAPGYYDHCDWDGIYRKLIASGTVSQTSMVDYETRVTIDARGNSPSYKAIFYVHG